MLAGQKELQPRMQALQVRGAEDKKPAAAHDPRYFGDDVELRIEMFQNLGHEHDIEGVVLEGQALLEVHTGGDGNGVQTNAVLDNVVVVAEVGAVNAASVGGQLRQYLALATAQIKDRKVGVPFQAADFPDHGIDDEGLRHRPSSSRSRPGRGNPEKVRFSDCAFTPFATYPLMPPENRLPVPIRSGELRYRAAPDSHMIHP